MPRAIVDIVPVVSEARNPIPDPSARSQPPLWKDEWAGFGFKLGPFPIWSVRLHLKTTGSVQPDPLQGVCALEGVEWPDTSQCHGVLLFDHPVAEPLPPRFEFGPWTCYTAWQGEHNVTDLTLGSEAYLASLSSNTRSQLKRKQRAFEVASGGTLDWRIYHTPAELDTFLGLALPLSRKTYQHKLFHAGLPEDPTHVAQLRALAEQGQVWAFLLWLKDDLVAYLCLEGMGTTLLYSYVGHDEAHSRLSPGTVLMAQALLYMQRQGKYRWFDFGSGDGQHKRQFATGRLAVATVFLLHQHWRHRLLLGSHHALTVFNHGVTDWLKRTGWHARLKQLARRATQDS